jgi:hypothetical protein
MSYTILHYCMKLTAKHSSVVCLIPLIKGTPNLTGNSVINPLKQQLEII